MTAVSQPALSPPIPCAPPGCPEVCPGGQAPASVSGQRAYAHLLRVPAAVVVLVALSACADKPAPLDNAFCVLYTRLPDPSDAIHLKKRENKVAILTNEMTFDQECLLGNRAKSLGPR